MFSMCVLKINISNKYKKKIPHEKQEQFLTNYFSNITYSAVKEKKTYTRTHLKTNNKNKKTFFFRCVFL